MPSARLKKLSFPTPAPCPDCGEGSVFHRMTYVTISIDEFMSRVLPISSNNGFITKHISRIERKVSPYLLTFLADIGIAKKQRAIDDKTLLLAKCLWEEANVRGIEMWEWRLGGLARNMFVARFPDGILTAFEGIPPASYEDDRVAWMDDKARLKEEFKKKGIAVAKGGSARTGKKAREIYDTLTPPVIVKPQSGSGSRHTVLHIMSEEELVRAYRIAKQVSPGVVIEEELIGQVYRATVVDGVFRAAIRRDPPSLVADGAHTVAELVAQENTNSKRQGPYFSHIQLNEAADQELAWQGYTSTSVPPQGTRVYFHQKVNWSVGGTTADVTDDVHKDNIALFEDAARELHAPIAGIDFIIADISRSWKEQDRTGILECNSMPFFDNHHLPFEGETRNVAAAIWDMVTPKP